MINDDDDNDNDYRKALYDMASSYWILEKLQMVGIASNIRHIIKAFTTTLPIVGKLIQRKI